MIVIGLLYNRNGMATWCLEAAHVLHSNGYDILLVIDEDQRPDLKDVIFPFKTFFWKVENSQNRTLKQKIGFYFDNYLFIKPSDFLIKLKEQLEEKSIFPSLFLLNQSDLQNKECTIPQYIVAWAFPCTVWGYLSKTLNQSPSLFSSKTIHSLVNAVVWYRKDWKAYRESDGVIGVSERLTHYLEQREVNVRNVYPPLRTNSTRDLARPASKVKILFAALNLENPQKKIEWGIRALADFKRLNEVEIHLVGNYTSLKDKTTDLGLNATFHGFLPPEKVRDIMESCDILIFCSSFDDWGYVQLEAMARGMAVISPCISPCDEILANPDLLFEPGNKESFLNSVEKVVSIDKLLTYKQYCQNRSAFFSEDTFLSQLGGIIKAKK